MTSRFLHTAAGQTGKKTITIFSDRLRQGDETYSY